LLISQLRLEAIIPPRPSYSAGSSKRNSGRKGQTGFYEFRPFFSVLPGLKNQFSEAEIPGDGAKVVWPGFGNEAGKGGSGIGRKRKRERREEVGLLEGVITGLEVCRLWQRAGDDI
jgi:hypothetical protein